MRKALLMKLPLLFLIILLYSQTGCQESQDIGGIRKELKELVKVEKSIQKDLQDIKTVLQATRQAPSPSEPQNVVLNIDKAPFKGDQDAKLTLIEFSDYQCPFCARHIRETFPQLDSNYIKTGKVKYVFKDFPLDFHQNAFKAAEAANCAGDEGKFWEMHDVLFKNQGNLAIEAIVGYAETLELDMSKFRQCLDSGKYANDIKKEIETGQRAGVTGTPSFFLGVTTPKDPNVKVVKFIRGAQSYNNFKEAIDNALSSEK
jgi:protein-disulfide isomerase